MDVDVITAKLVRRYGDAVAPWAAAAPRRAAELSELWGLRLGAAFDGGASSVTFACDTADGARAVLKLSPDTDVLIEQTAVLRWWQPTGRVPAVLAACGDAVLLAAIEPGTAAADVDPSADEWAALVGALHGNPGAPPAPMRTLGDRFEFFARIGRRLDEPAVAARVSRELWALSERRCHELAATESARVVLHGDLHLHNVLVGGAGRGLVAIDPKVIHGDPCFDLVDFVLHGAGREDLRARCARTAVAYGVDPDRLLAWSRAVAPVVAVAHVDHDDVVTPLLTLAR